MNSIHAGDYRAPVGKKVDLGKWPTRVKPVVVPADDKETAQLIVSHVILRTLRDLELVYPILTPERQRELEAARKA